MPSAPPPLPPGGWVELPGRGRTWVWDTGPGGRPDRTPILLLHGWTSTAALNWHACFAPLAAEGRVVALDHRGHGRGITAGPYTLETLADDAAALLGVLGIERAAVAGYSMGGPVAQLLWRRHPGLVAGLVLCATAATFASRPVPPGVLSAVGAGLSAALGAVPPSLRVAGMSRYVGNRYPDPAPWERTERAGGRDPLPLLRSVASVATFDSTPWIGELDRPATVVVTTADQTVAPSLQRSLADAIPGAVRIDIDGDHRVCIGDPGRFVPAVLAGYRHAARPDGRDGVADRTH